MADANTTAPPQSPVEVLQAYKYPTLIIAIGIFLAILGFQLALRYDLKQAGNNFQNVSEQVYRTLDSQILRHHQQITTIARLLEDVSTEDFNQISRTLSYETNFISISEYRINPDGTLIEPHSYTTATYPVLYPHLKSAIERVTDSTYIAPPHELVVSSEHRVFISPIIARIPSDNPDESPRYIVGFVNLTALLQKEFETHREKTHVQIYVRQNKASTLIFQQYATPHDETYLSNLTDQNYADLFYLRKRNFNDHEWEIRIYSSTSGFTNAIGALPWITLLSSLLVTMLLGYLTLRITTESVKVRTLAARQTRDLRKYTKQLEASNQDLDDFVHIASHDLKEPLRGMYNYAGILLEDYGDKLNADGTQKLETLQALARRMEVLIDTLLKYSLITREEFKRSHVNMTDIANDAAKTLSIYAAEHNAVIHVDNNMPHIDCDPVRVGEIFTNLITNAIKYNDSPEKRVEIGYTMRHEKHAGIPVFYVRDNGIGIAADNRDMVFKIFRRLHGRNKYGGGTGSGLTIIKKIIDRHNGDIWIETSASGGSIFYFTLQRSQKK